MNSEDLKIICTAISFAIIATQPGKIHGTSNQVQKLAQLMEAYRAETAPEKFNKRIAKNRNAKRAKH